MNLLKMYLLLKMVIFHVYVSLFRQRKLPDLPTTIPLVNEHVGNGNPPFFNAKCIHKMVDFQLRNLVYQKCIQNFWLTVCDGTKLSGCKKLRISSNSILNWQNDGINHDDFREFAISSGLLFC